ncbi:MAG: YbaK/EbsC family protein [Syntrophomonadaceae bacterium]|nr:YbaK/EbsC family protein [Syntrophomonadaceae bacterium]
MSLFKKVQAYLDAHHPGLQAIELDENTATCELAAAALEVEVGQIAKSLVFKGKQEFVMVVAAGDVRISTKKIRQIVGSKVRMATAEEVLEITGYPIGGVCPIDLKTPLRILLDNSLAQYPLVYAAAGTANSALPVTLAQLQEITGGEIVALVEDAEEKAVS